MSITTRTLTYQFQFGPSDSEGGEDGGDFQISWQDVINTHPSWQDVKDTRSSWNDVLLNG